LLTNWVLFLFIFVFVSVPVSVSVYFCLKENAYKQTLKRIHDAYFAGFRWRNTEK
jgi:hypothetical protein